MNWLSSLPLQLALVFGTVVISFIGGCQFGQNRIEAKWGAARSAQVIDAARQSQRVVDTHMRQDQINQEISNEFNKKQAALASSLPVVRDGHIGLLFQADRDHGPVPEVPSAAARVEAVAANYVFDTTESLNVLNCSQLFKDAQTTTLMLLELQRWHQLNFDLQNLEGDSSCELDGCQ